VLPDVLRLFSILYPAKFPYHPNAKADKAHPAYWLIYASIDHHQAQAGGGDDDPDNLITACWPCNHAKRNASTTRIGWRLRDRPTGTTSWDGLTRLYPQLREAAKQALPPGAKMPPNVATQIAKAALRHEYSQAPPTQTNPHPVTSQRKAPRNGVAVMESAEKIKVFQNQDDAYLQWVDKNWGWLLTEQDGGSPWGAQTRSSCKSAHPASRPS
jgi:HNH endonuclease